MLPLNALQGIYPNRQPGVGVQTIRIHCRPKRSEMRVLVACEESQAVCIAFRELEHEAYSCDILPCSGGHPEWHIQDDAIRVLYSRKWDLVIAHPPCTRLANSG